MYVCMFFSNIDSAFFECLPWSTGADIHFVSLQVSPFQFSKKLQQNLVSATKIHHIASGFIKYSIVASSACSSCDLSARLITDDWI